MRSLLILISAILLISCEPNKTQEHTQIKIELPDTTNSDLLLYKIKNRLIDELNLSRLEAGVDSFVLRLGAKISLFPKGQLIVIKKINGQWNCLGGIGKWVHD